MPSRATSRRRSRAALWAPVIAYLAFIFALSSMPGPPTLPSGTDKGLHYLLYGGLGILIARGLAGGDFAAIGWRVAVAATILAALYGWTDEIHQRFVAGRTFEYWDIVADATGAACGAVAARLWGRMGHDL